MTVSSPPLWPATLRQLLEAEMDHGLDQAGLLHHWLGTPNAHEKCGLSRDKSALAALQDAIIVGLDAEWYEHDSNFITELGVCILDPRNLASSNKKKSPWDMLAALETHHVRIKPNAHLVNKDLCAGHPASFQFGSTTFASPDAAERMLRSVFVRCDADGRPRPVLFLGHAVDNDYDMVRARFGLDLQRLGTIVATLDTQVVACDLGIAPAGRKMRLQHLLEHYGLHEAYLHNAGNDIVCTAVVALLMACGAASTTTTSATAYEQLKRKLCVANHAGLPDRVAYGQRVFCEMCDSDRHLRAHCKAVDLHCAKCAADPRRASRSKLHSTEKCADEVRLAAQTQVRARGRRADKLRYPVPCQWCVESVVSARYNAAYGHRKEECPWEPVF